MANLEAKTDAGQPESGYEFLGAMRTNPCACLAFAVLWSSTLLAGDFVNLGFDDPDLSHATSFQSGPLVGQSAPTSEAIRGWTFFSANSPTPDRTYIGVATTPPVALIGVGRIPGTGVDFGKYGLYLANHSLAPDSLQPIYHLSQFGTIPAGATELVYYRSPGTSSPGTPGAFQILINNLPVPYTEGRFTSIGIADVSGFAGQQVNLEFVFPKGGSEFDIAGFTIAPEPSTYALFAVGAVGLWWQCRRRSSP